MTRKKLPKTIQKVELFILITICIFIVVLQYIKYHDHFNKDRLKALKG